eukprot:m.149190 g.149190  ORF g.149190 m.149190 type:complete len:446 (-) comp16287_c0_seq4:1639-2976(-)
MRCCFCLLWALTVLPTLLNSTQVCPLHSTALDGVCTCDAAFPLCQGKECNTYARPTMAFPIACASCTCHHQLLAATVKPDEVFQRYAVLHQLIRSGAHPERTLVYLCSRGCGGTGDRNRGIITAFYLALFTKRAFFIHSTIPQPLETFFGSTYINWSWPDTWSHPHATLTFMASQPGDLVINRTLQQDLAPSLAIRINEYAVPNMFHWNRSFTDILQEWEAYGALHSKDRFQQSHRQWGIDTDRIVPRFQSLAQASGLDRLPSPMHAAYHRLFQPTPLLRNAVTEFASKHSWGVHQPFISVHLRTGLDFKTDPNRLPLDAFDQAFDCIVKHTQGSESLHWHVASDTKRVLDQFQERFRDNGWDPNRVMSIFNLPDATSVHVDRFAGSELATAAKAEVFVHLDFWLLSHAKEVFASTSTFSRTAAAVGGHERVILVPSCTSQAVLY